MFLFYLLEIYVLKISKHNIQIFVLFFCVLLYNIFGDFDGNSRKIKDFSLYGCALSYKDIVIEKIKFSGLFSLSERKYIKFIKKCIVDITFQT